MENEKKDNAIKTLCTRWFITAFSGMAQGLFCTLIAGTILSLIAGWVGDNVVGKTLSFIASFAKTLMGAGIGIGIAYSLKHNKLVVFSAGVLGLVGAFADKLVLGQMPIIQETSKAYLLLGSCGNPIGAYVVAIIACEIAGLYVGKTKLDIIIVPLGMMIMGLGLIYVAYPFIFVINKLAVFIGWATTITPFFMGIIIAVIMGVLLTMPTSSAAIWIAIAGTQQDNAGILLAGGAAVVGCCCHMVGFAVTSYRENGVGGLIAQGLGTSMLQIPNIMKKPIIMLPEIISSAILGPVATCLFHLNCNASGGGMGTSGLVGVFGVLNVNPQMNGFVLAIAIALLMFILPAVISLAVSEFMRKKGIIKLGDMKLDD